jgi:putative transposase
MPSLHHIVSLGTSGTSIFHDREDFDSFLERLAVITARYRWRVLAYCLMTTHTHLLVEAGRTDLRVGNRRLRTSHARGLSIRHGITTPIWTPSTRPVPITTDRRLWATAAYIACNPMDAGMVADPIEYEWSSHAAMLGAAVAPGWLDMARLFELLGGSTGPLPRARYARYVIERGRRQKAVPAAWERAS